MGPSIASVPPPPSLVRPERRPDALELFFSSSGRLSRLPFLAGEATVLGLLRLYDRWIVGWPRRLTGWAVLFVLLFAGCCLASRRLHDLGRSGWWTFLYLGVFLCAWPRPWTWLGALLAVMTLELTLRPGQGRPNRFGAALSPGRP